MELQTQGAHNINLVTATQYLPWVLPALELVKPALRIPVVYNCGGYERVETIRALKGLCRCLSAGFQVLQLGIILKLLKRGGLF